MRNLLLDIELWPQSMPSISLHCDSQAIMSIALNKIYNGKSRHEYVRQLITDGIITITYVRSCKNLANPFTKSLARDLVRSATVEMGLQPFD